MTAVLVQLERQGGHPGIREGAILLPPPDLQGHQPDPCNSAPYELNVLSCPFYGGTPVPSETRRHHPRATESTQAEFVNGQTAILNGRESVLT